MKMQALRHIVFVACAVHGAQIMETYLLPASGGQLSGTMK